ncbi:extensin-like [Benincasa hispida]|uniref:extensin-like n=1 Tax=Benincasa hispida TaxID=102211 RepID=UPI001900EF50|nr:extensin-like [Benincasa hispida]
MSSSGSPPGEGRKELRQISNNSRKIKKPPRPPKTAKTAAPSPVVRYENEPKIIKVETPQDFKYIVQLLTGDPNRPPPQYPCTSNDHDPQPPDDRPQGILSPTPTSLPLLVYPDAFTPSPSPPPPLPLPLPPSSSDQELCIFDLLEEWAEPAALSSYPVVDSPPLLPPPPLLPAPVPPAPNFRVPPSPFRTLNTEIPPSFNTPLPPLFFPPNHFPHNN